MRIGVVGNGMIVGRFLEDISRVEGACVTALCVRDHSLDKGKALADTYGIGRVMTDYPEFLRSEDIDTVYIGIINSMHYDYVRQALDAGKHVICEKPFTVEAWEAKELAASAKAKGLFLWEAFKIPYSPVFAGVKAHLADIGDVKLVQCNYSRVSSRYKDYAAGRVLPAFDPKLAGGCLYDINLYNLHFTVALFGRPSGVRYYANKGYNGIDTSGTLVLTYDGFYAVLTGAKDSSSPCGCVLQGTKGYIQVEGPASAAVSARLKLGGDAATKPDSDAATLGTDKDHGSLAGELRAFERQYREQDYESCYRMLDHSLTVMEVLEAAREDAGIVFG